MFNQAESVFIEGKEVESIITADGGVVYQKDSGIEEIYVTDFSSFTKINDTTLLSDFEIPFDHEIEMGFKDTPNVQISFYDTDNNYLYSQTFGLYDRYQLINPLFYYMNNTSRTYAENKTMTLRKESIYTIMFKESSATLCNIQVYQDNQLKLSKNVYKRTLNNFHVRIFGSVDSVAYLKIKKLN